MSSTPKPPLIERAVAAAVGAASPPLGRIADGLDRLNGLLERYLQHNGIPELEPIVRELVDDKPLTAARDDWEVALDEEIAERRKSVDREIQK